MPAAPPSPERWDRDYEEGRWDFLESMQEMARSMVLVGYAGYARPRPRVLDVGCGAGRLLRLLGTLPLETYLGIDISQAAIDRASTLAVPGATFVAASFEEWAPPHPFDVVIFNESLNYARHPLAVARRSLDWIAADGLLLVSMFRVPASAPIWDALRSDAAFELLDTTVVENRAGLVWDVAAFRRRTPGRRLGR